jgi:hypothetical protein
MTAPGVEFASFVASLAAGAAGALAQVEDLHAGKAPPGGEAEATRSPQEVREQADAALAAARQLIDTLVMLEKKTAGNLTPEESETLRTSLTNLRIAFVRVATPTN